MKTAFLITGFLLDATAADDRFTDVRKEIQDLGYKVVAVDVSYKRRTLSSFSREFIKIYNSQKSDHNIIIGNSFGAIVAFISAATVSKAPDRLVLCSLSPYFKELLEANPETRLRAKRFGALRVQDLSNISYRQTAQRVVDHGLAVDLLYGELEKEDVPHLVDFVKRVASEYPEFNLHEVKGAPHAIRNPQYYKGLVTYLRGVNG